MVSGALGFEQNKLQKRAFGIARYKILLYIMHILLGSKVWVPKENWSQHKTSQEF